MTAQAESPANTDANMCSLLDGTTKKHVTYRFRSAT
jgi:hypothetical protein